MTADLVVVADAGMFSAKNLNAIEDAGMSFIVGSRISKAPYDLAAHFDRHCNAFIDGQVLESARLMGTGKAARRRRVTYQYRFARHKRDDRAINAMVDRAEKVAAGKRPLKKEKGLSDPIRGSGPRQSRDERPLSCGDRRVEVRVRARTQRDHEGV